jgi:hypothetical protein
MVPQQTFYQFIITAPPRTPQPTDLIPIVAGNTTWNCTVSQLSQAAGGIVQITMTNQTGAGGPYNVLNAAPGQYGTAYSLTCWLAITATDTGGATVTQTANWTDPVLGPQTTANGPVGFTTTNYSIGTTNEGIVVAAGTPLTITITLTGTLTTGRFGWAAALVPTGTI